jgi:hypothetical protein
MDELIPIAVPAPVVLAPAGTPWPADRPRPHEALAVALQAQPAPLGLYLQGLPPARAEEALAQWRAGPHWFRPAFVDPASAVPHLADGAAPWDEALRVAHHADAIARSLTLDPATLRFDERLLYHLYLREPAELVPVRDRNAKYLYRYPIVESLEQGQEDSGAWLGALVRRNLLQPGTLVDRTRHCRQCASAHLHFLDVCPHCSSIEIRKGASLHCFACGHVAPEGDFHGDLGLVCPKCNAHLRHIGVDYDRPLTQFACARCHHAFIEPAVIVRCLDCAAEDDPSALDVREVSVLRLSPHGRAALRAGQLQESFAVLETSNHVVPNFFRRMLDWALATQGRHKELRFGLVLIEFLNATALIDAQGATRTFLMLDELARRLRELLRVSDLTTRTSEQVLWVFLPFSSGEGFAARVRKALDEAQTPEGARLEARLAWIQAPEELEPNLDADALMARLQRWDTE